ncbi:MAG: mitochondrial fission ELM1 family protein [Nitrospirales bacterium]
MGDQQAEGKEDRKGEVGSPQWKIFSGHTLPQTWVLLDDRPGNSTQSMGLADSLGWPYEVKQLNFLSSFSSRNWHLPAMISHVDLSKSPPLSPPWPDLVIAAGQRTAPVAKWIKNQSQDQIRLVQLGRKGGLVMDHFDLVVTPRYCQMPPHPNRLMTTVSLNRITPEKLSKAAQEGSPVMQNSPRPRIVCLVGGATPRYQLDLSIARQLGADLERYAKETGGQVFVLTSRRTGQAVEKTLREKLGRAGQMFAWNPQKNTLPYLTALALADVIVVTGESEAMLAEVAATDKPMCIYPLPKRPRTFIQNINPVSHIKGWLLNHSYLSVAGEHGRDITTSRIKDLCTWFFARGYCHPPRRLEVLHEDLYSRGIAQVFGTPLNAPSRTPFNETFRVADYIKSLFGCV